jgi:hypothetical protein
LVEVQGGAKKTMPLGRAASGGDGHRVLLKRPRWDSSLDLYLPKSKRSGIGPKLCALDFQTIIVNATMPTIMAKILMIQSIKDGNRVMMTCHEVFSVGSLKHAHMPTRL